MCLHASVYVGRYLSNGQVALRGLVFTNFRGPLLEKVLVAWADSPVHTRAGVVVGAVKKPATLHAKRYNCPSFRRERAGQRSGVSYSVGLTRRTTPPLLPRILWRDFEG